MLYKKIIVSLLLAGAGWTAYNIGTEVPTTINIVDAARLPESAPKEVLTIDKADIPEVDSVAFVTEEIETEKQILNKEDSKEIDTSSDTLSKVFTVPFFSQFTDITSPKWKKVGCGIASLAMLIDFYKPGDVSVDTLLSEGIEAHAYTDAGWTHAGLIGLSKIYGLSGTSHDMAAKTMTAAFDELQGVLKEGPVMVSVHYTFDPNNPIPHLVVVNGVSDGMVYYNDPAEKAGGGSITISKFQSSWKKRYIQIHPVT